jgi:hypothetical protein
MSDEAIFYLNGFITNRTADTARLQIHANSTSGHYNPQVAVWCAISAQEMGPTFSRVITVLVTVNAEHYNHTTENFFLLEMRRGN